jgi:hypothetical protein
VPLIQTLATCIWLIDLFVQIVWSVHSGGDPRKQQHSAATCIWLIDSNLQSVCADSLVGSLVGTNTSNSIQLLPIFDWLIVICICLCSRLLPVFDWLIVICNLLVQIVWSVHSSGDPHEQQHSVATCIWLIDSNLQSLFVQIVWSVHSSGDPHQQQHSIATCIWLSDSNLQSACADRLVGSLWWEPTRATTFSSYLYLID